MKNELSEEQGIFTESLQLSSVHGCIKCVNWKEQVFYRLRDRQQVFCDQKWKQLLNKGAYRY